MFRAILETQWKSTRAVVLLITVLAFGVPMFSLRSASRAYGADGFVSSMQEWGAMYAALAAVAGLLVALSAWRADHAGRHVYALSLPIPRPRFALFRLGAGAIFLAPPVVALLVGALVVAQSSAVPEGLHAYPVALTIRFALASAVAFAIFFAIAGSSPRTAGMVLAAMAGVVLAQYLLELGGSSTDVIGPVLDFILYRPGVLSVFSGRWMLVDV